MTKKLLSILKKHYIVFLFLFVCIVHLAIINDYGFTWDFQYHFFGGGKLLGYSWQQLDARAVPYGEPDPRNSWTLPYGPIMSIVPVASNLLLYKQWHLLPSDSAYHLPIILWGIAGISIIYLFMKQAFSDRVALFAALFLALTPRYFADMHNNMKDVPSAVSFALNMWLLWRLVKFRRLIDLFWAILAFALAFNVKINSIFIPIVFAVWLICNTLLKKVTGDKIFKDRFPSFKTKNLFEQNVRGGDVKSDRPASSGSRKFLSPGAMRMLLSYFPLAPIAAFLLWSVFWPDPIGSIKYAIVTFGVGTNNIEVLLDGSWYCSGSTVPWYYPYWYLAITTPLPILICFFAGIVYILYFLSRNTKYVIQNTNKHTYILILLWFFLPLARYFIPAMGVIDGVRHFEEVLFPLAALAAIGLDFILRQIRHIHLLRLMRPILILLSISYLLYANYSYHPYQITYFNELVGGIKGAFGKYDLDYWGTSQKAAIEWVNAHAPQNAKVYIMMAPDVASLYLRPDLIANLNKSTYTDSDFVVILNRQSFYYRYFYTYDYLLQHVPTHTVTIHGIPLTWVFDNRTNNTTPRKTPWWQGEDPCIIQYWKGAK